MIPQPAVTYERLKELYQRGIVSDSTIVWFEGQKSNYYHFRDIRREIEGDEEKKPDSSPQEFVSTLDMPTLKHGQKPREYFQTATREELFDEVKRFLQEKTKQEKRIKSSETE